MSWVSPKTWERVLQSFPGMGEDLDLSELKLRPFSDSPSSAPLASTWSRTYRSPFPVPPRECPEVCWIKEAHESLKASYGNVAGFSTGQQSWLPPLLSLLCLNKYSVPGPWFTWLAVFTITLYHYQIIMLHRWILNEAQRGKWLAKRHTANKSKAWRQNFLTSFSLSYPLNYAYNGFLGVEEGYLITGAVMGEKR